MKSPPLSEKKPAKQLIKTEIPSCKVLVADIKKIEELTQLNDLNKKEIDALINNVESVSAGVSIKDTDLNEIEKQFQIHCLGSFNVIQTVYPSLSLSKNSLIINISSRLGAITRNAKGEFILYHGGILIYISQGIKRIIPKGERRRLRAQSRFCIFENCIGCAIDNSYI